MGVESNCGDDRIACVIADEHVGWALEVSEKMSIPRAVFWLASALQLAINLNIPKFIEDGIITAEETGGFKFSLALCGVAQHQVEPSPSKDSSHYSRASIRSMQHSVEYIDQIEEATGEFRHQYEQCSLEGSPQSFRTPIQVMHYDTEYIDQIHQDFTSNQTECITHSWVKWRNGNQQNVVEHDSYISDDLVGKCAILDIFSGFMHLAGGSVVPETISRDCLENANVLLQLDKNFILVVAGGTLVVIDQVSSGDMARVLIKQSSTVFFATYDEIVSGYFYYNAITRYKILDCGC